MMKEVTCDGTGCGKVFAMSDDEHEWYLLSGESFSCPYCRRRWVYKSGSHAKVVQKLREQSKTIELLRARNDLLFAENGDAPYRVKTLQKRIDAQTLRIKKLTAKLEAAE
jgi:hypothetical protein